MPELKLPKLPDRTQLKVNISLHPELSEKLRAYAEFYKKAYGETESVAEMIPYMLDAFLAADRAFVKWSKQQFEQREELS